METTGIDGTLETTRYSSRVGKACVILAVCVLGMLDASGEWNEATKTYDTAGYIQLKGNDGGNVGSFAAESNWKDGEAPQAGQKYFVPYGKQLRILNTVKEPFKGDVLALEGSCTCPAPTVSIPTWHLLSRSVFYVYLASVTFTNSEISVYNTNTKPAQFLYGVSNGRSEDNGAIFKNVAFKVAADTSLSFYTQRTNSFGYFNMKEGCDVSQFYGTLEVTTAAEFWDSSYAGVRFGSGKYEFPGTIYLGTNSVLNVCDVTSAKIAESDVTIANLRTDPNAVVRTICINGRVRTVSVTGTFDHRAPLSVVVESSGNFQTEGAVEVEEAVPFRVKVPEGDSGVQPAFTLEDVVPHTALDFFGLPHFTWCVRRRDGWDELVGTALPLVVKTSDIDVENVTSLTNKEAWSDGEFPHGGADYYCPKSLRIFDSPDVWGANNIHMSSETNHKVRTYVFPGNSLTLGPLCNAQFTRVNGLAVPSLTMVAGSVLTIYGSNWNLYTQEPLHILPYLDYLARFYVYNGSSVTIENGMDGAGDIWCEFRGKNFPDGTVVIKGINTNFTGKVLMACLDYVNPSSVNYVVSETNRVEVIVDDARNLGGARSSFTWNALRIRDYSLLDVTNTTTFAELTRGVFVDGVACLRVAEGQTVSFLPQFTFGGELRKQGMGTLALGGPKPAGATCTSVADDAYVVSPEPSNGANVLHVQAGGVKPLSKTAFDGLNLRFSKGTKLVLDWDPVSQEVATYGLFNVSSATPFDFDADVESIEVCFDTRVATAFEGGSKTLGVATVSADKADALFAKLRAVRPFPQTKVTLFKAVSGNQATITATVSPCGFMILFR